MVSYLTFHGFCRHHGGVLILIVVEDGLVQMYKADLGEALVES